MLIKLLPVILLIELTLISIALAEDFKVGDYNAYAIIGESNLIEEADYVSFTGDFGFRRQTPPNDAIEYHLSHESDLLSNFQLSVINLEFMLIGMSGQALDIQMDNVMISILKRAGYDLIGLANNHVMDFGTEGIQYNDLELKRSGLTTIGTHESPIYYWDTGGLKVAIYALTDYIDNPDHDRLILRVDKADLTLIKNQEHESDFQIAFVHLGSMSSYVSPHESDQVKRLIEAGIDLVVCTGSHYIKGIVKSNGIPVAYGIGNHLFSYSDDDTEPIGMHLVAGFVVGELKQLFLVPFYNSVMEGKIGPLNKSDFELFKKTLTERSTQDTILYFSDPSNLNKLKDQFSRFNIKNLYNLKFRHFKYALGIILYSYTKIIVAICVLLVVSLALWIYSQQNHRKKQ